MSDPPQPIPPSLLSQVPTRSMFWSSFTTLPTSLASTPTSLPSYTPGHGSLVPTAPNVPRVSLMAVMVEMPDLGFLPREHHVHHWRAMAIIVMMGARVFFLDRYFNGEKIYIYLACLKAGRSTRMESLRVVITRCFPSGRYLGKKKKKKIHMIAM